MIFLHGTRSLLNPVKWGLLKWGLLRFKGIAVKIFYFLFDLFLIFVFDFFDFSDKVYVIFSSDLPFLSTHVLFIYTKNFTCEKSSSEQCSENVPSHLEKGHGKLYKMWSKPNSEAIPVKWVTKERVLHKKQRSRSSYSQSGKKIFPWRICPSLAAGEKARINIIYLQQ